MRRGGDGGSQEPQIRRSFILVERRSTAMPDAPGRHSNLVQGIQSVGLPGRRMRTHTLFEETKIDTSLEPKHPVLCRKAKRPCTTVAVRVPKKHKNAREVYTTLAKRKDAVF